MEAARYSREAVARSADSGEPIDQALTPRFDELDIVL
jgi:hypothetical protein